MHVEIVGDHPEHRRDERVDEEFSALGAGARSAGLAARHDLIGFVLARYAERQNGEQHGPPDDEIECKTEGPVHGFLYHTSAVWTRTTGFLPRTSFAARRAAMRPVRPSPHPGGGLPLSARSTASLTGAIRSQGYLPCAALDRRQIRPLRSRMRVTPMNPAKPRLRRARA